MAINGDLHWFVLEVHDQDVDDTLLLCRDSERDDHEGQSCAGDLFLAAIDEQSSNRM